MLFTLIALRSIWYVLRERQQRRLARLSLRQLTEIDETEERPAFWRAVRARFRQQASSSEARRARSRKAISRLSRLSERKLEKRSRIDMRKYTAR
jgi:hypothetical protein